METLFIRHGGGNIRYCLLVDHKDEREPDEEQGQGAGGGGASGRRAS